MTLTEMLASLDLRKQKQILDALEDASLAHELGKTHKTVFRERIKTDAATGRQKKLYSALAKTDKAGMERMAATVIRMRPIIEAALKINKTNAERKC